LWGRPPACGGLSGRLPRIAAIDLDHIPPRRIDFYWFNSRLLLEAKVAFHLKESLGTSTEVLARFTRALSNVLNDWDTVRLRYVWLQSRPAKGRESVEIRIPLRDLAKELEEQLPRAAVYQDLPRR